jgi:hypothetical protein
MARVFGVSMRQQFHGHTEHFCGSSPGALRYPNAVGFTGRKAKLRKQFLAASARRFPLPDDGCEAERPAHAQTDLGQLLLCVLKKFHYLWVNAVAAHAQLPCEQHGRVRTISNAHYRLIIR